MSDFTILSRGKVLPGVSPLDIFKVGNTELAAVTDFSILLGARSEGKKDLGDSVAETSYWWTKEGNWGRKGGKKAYVICPSGQCVMADVDATWVGARPALPYSSIKSVSLNERIRDFDGIKEIEYGEYPQTVVDEYYSLKLEDLYNYGNLKPTDKKYTTGKGSVHTEYEYNGSKYIRFVADLKYDGQFLSDGRKVHTGGVYWLRVEPIVWFVDEIADVALSKKVIFSGVEFQGYRCEVDFDKSSIKEFMDRFFSREIVPCMEHSRNELEVQSLRERGARAAGVRCYANHPYVYAYVAYKSFYGYDVLSDRLDYWKMVSELLYKTKNLEILPDMLKKLIGDKLAKDFIAFISQQVISKEDVLSYNYSSEDLEMSVSQFFATLAELLFVDVKYNKKVRCFKEKIKLNTSGMKSGTVFVFENWTNFSKRFETNEKLKEIKPCYEKKSVEQVSNTSNFDDVSGKDIDNKKSVANKTSDDFDFVNVPEENIENKEPDETQIFGAINFDNNSEEDTESKESFANKTSNDFDSVPEEDTESKELAEKQVFDTVNLADDSEETETKIHPYVYAYIAYKSYSGDKLNVEPKTWEIVSKVLYKTKQPDVLRELLGDDLTNDFIAFTNQQVISLEDVINHNYSKEDLEMNTSQKFATAANLAFVNDEHFGAVRDFMKQVGTTSMSVFEFMWAYGDESRLEKIAEAQMIDGLSQRKTKVRRKKKN